MTRVDHIAEIINPGAFKNLRAMEAEGPLHWNVENVRKEVAAAKDKATRVMAELGVPAV